jgi:hypothetical protein
VHVVTGRERHTLSGIEVLYPREYCAWGGRIVFCAGGGNGIRGSNSMHFAVASTVQCSAASAQAVGMCWVPGACMSCIVPRYYSHACYAIGCCRGFCVAFDGWLKFCAIIPLAVVLNTTMYGVLL